MQSEYMKEMQAFMVESMKSAVIDFGSTMANVIRQQLSRTSASKARDELAEPSKKRALSPGSPRERREMSKRKKEWLIQQTYI